MTHLKDVKPDPKNTRRHNPRNVGMVESSIQREGFGRSILVANDGTIIAGNATADAAASAGLEEMIVVDSDGTKVIAVRRTDVEPGSDRFHKLAIADNRAAELAEWDPAMLQQLAAEDIELSQFFRDDELDALLASLSAPVVGLTDPDEVPPVPEVPVTKPGNLWLLGRHRLLCGDATVVTDVERLMGGERADLVFTSPPYLDQRDYAGNLGPWDQLMNDTFSILPIDDAGQVLVNLGMVHRDGEWLPYWDDWIEMMRTAGWRRFGWYVWDQGSGLPGDWNGRFAPSHEFVFHFNRVSLRPHKTKQCKRAGEFTAPTGMRDKDGVVRRFTKPGPVNETKITDSVIRISRHMARGIEVGHPAIFPVELVTEILTAFSDPGDVLYEPFLGSGTAIMGAEQCGRSCYAMELTPAYVDIAVKRWQNFTGQTAVLAHDHAMVADS